MRAAGARDRPPTCALRPRVPVVLNVGLTGGIAVGKSTVVATFRDLGAVCFDADVIARALVAPGMPALVAITSEFGDGILAPDGTLDRAALGRVVFGDAERRARLEAILHPPIVAEQDRLVAEAALRDPHGVAIVEAALMIESGSYKRFDALVVVYCDERVQVERLMRRNGLALDAALARIRAQMPQAQKLALADYAIDTTGPLGGVRGRVERVWAELARRAAGR